MFMLFYSVGTHFISNHVVNCQQMLESVMGYIFKYQTITGLCSSGRLQTACMISFHNSSWRENGKFWPRIKHPVSRGCSRRYFKACPSLIPFWYQFFLNNSLIWILSWSGIYLMNGKYLEPFSLTIHSSMVSWSSTCYHLKHCLWPTFFQWTYLKTIHKIKGSSPNPTLNHKTNHMVKCLMSLAIFYWYNIRQCSSRTI